MKEVDEMQRIMVSVLNKLKSSSNNSIGYRFPAIHGVNEGRSGEKEGRRNPINKLRGFDNEKFYISPLIN